MASGEDDRESCAAGAADDTVGCEVETAGISSSAARAAVDGECGASTMVGTNAGVDGEAAEMVRAPEAGSGVVGADIHVVGVMYAGLTVEEEESTNGGVLGDTAGADGATPGLTASRSAAWPASGL